MILTKKQKKEFYEKVGKYASKKLRSIQGTELLLKEIGEITGLPANRISEIVNQGHLNHKKLASLLQGEILSIAELKKHADLTRAEERFLDSEYHLFENKALLEKMKIAADEGVDLLAVVQAAITKQRKKNKLAQTPPSKVTT